MAAGPPRVGSRRRPQALCDHFSKRSAEIDTWLEQTGRSNDRAGRQAAVLGGVVGSAQEAHPMAVEVFSSRAPQPFHPLLLSAVGAACSTNHEARCRDPMVVRIPGLDDRGHAELIRHVAALQSLVPGCEPDPTPALEDERLCNERPTSQLDTGLGHPEIDDVRSSHLSLTGMAISGPPVGRRHPPGARSPRGDLTPDRVRP